jgi:hypothetical protein
LVAGWVTGRREELICSLFHRLEDRLERAAAIRDRVLDLRRIGRMNGAHNDVFSLKTAQLTREHFRRDAVQVAPQVSEPSWTIE